MPSRARHIENSDIAEVLAVSKSRKEAARRLHIAPASLERRCRVEHLIPLYEALVARGNMLKGPTRYRPYEPPAPYWGIHWRQPGEKPIRIWGVQAETEAEAIAVAMNVVAKIVARCDVSAVREVMP